MVIEVLDQALEKIGTAKLLDKDMMESCPKHTIKY